MKKDTVTIEIDRALWNATLNTIEEARLEFWGEDGDPDKLTPTDVVESLLEDQEMIIEAFNY